MFDKISDREIDENVAKYLFSKTTERIGGDLRERYEYPGVSGTWTCLIPCYSTNITDAWKVVDKMRELGYSVHISAIENGKTWTVYFGKYSTLDTWEGYGVVVCRAICLAALNYALSPNRSPEKTS